MKLKELSSTLRSPKTVGDRPEALIETIAARQLLSPWQFYRLCKQARRTWECDRLYFYPLPPALSKSFPTPALRQFLDALAVTVGQSPCLPDASTYHLQSREGYRLSLRVTYAGVGLVGRVVKVSLLDSSDSTVSECQNPCWAFKACFEPQWVWQHGIWAEIPIGLYLRSQGVSRDMARFQAAGLTWMLWEWIDETEKPENRPGLDYETLAQRDNLTSLNPLNTSNYNRHGVRLDAGGIQVNFWGRRWRDAVYTLGFYWRRFRAVGWEFLRPHFNLKSLRYSLRRTWRLLRGR
ncbi:hypothetical protein NEA10_10055 [Phormidium yuhuli AB48]|uniref:Uncharacterized protein n=1 Tax=Phormidium yuhuli AB48 TaxID=2940671 RepID=A0ABY5AUW6_9CYAN|nr:hypothetical protein [Phormidium yuhuli]USR93032.1 hypothetical protein NEA10_10055 [Phormidium yuhuli AB48]